MANSYLDPLLSNQPVPRRDGRSTRSSQGSAFQDQLSASDRVSESRSGNRVQGDIPNSEPASTRDTRPLDNRNDGRRSQSDVSTPNTDSPQAERNALGSQTANERSSDTTDDDSLEDDRQVEQDDASGVDASANGSESSAEDSQASNALDGNSQLAAGNRKAPDPLGVKVDSHEVNRAARDSAETSTNRRTADLSIENETPIATDGELLRDSTNAHSTKTDASGASATGDVSKGAAPEVHSDRANGKVVNGDAETSSSLAPNHSAPDSLSTEASTANLFEDRGGEDTRHGPNLATARANTSSNDNGEQAQPDDAVAPTGSETGQASLSVGMPGDATPQSARRSVGRRESQANRPSTAADVRLESAGISNGGDAIDRVAEGHLASPGADAKTNLEIQPSAADIDVGRPDDGQSRPQPTAGRAFATPLAVGTSGRSAEAALGGDGDRLRVDPARFVSRVANAFQLAEDRGGQLRLRLSPPELGSIRLEVAVKQGAVTATIETETAAARRVLLDNLPLLRDRLAEQNIRIEQFDVDVRDDGAGSRHDQAASSGDQRHNADRPDRRADSNDPRNDVTDADSDPRTASLRGDETLNIVA